ncbi:hypothetical protein NDU88_005828 [Pleurodeles waltl]|uniref:Uncharacterized protein n=1 Tax=Pleurodeles waltl TaxID=8319 RepID=A0AAV7NNX7_PLEWA|nr:hypothetical protein NDU88_005828 [Pleurodeles waltl]
MEGKGEGPEHTVHSSAEDQEVLWCRLSTLDEQQIELQARGGHNNLRIRGVPRGAEGDDVLFLSRVLLGSVGSAADRAPLVLDRVHRIAMAAS